MKAVFMLLVLLPLAFSKPLEKKMIFGNILDTNELKHIMSLLVNALGSDTTEQLCEKECPLIVKADVLKMACPLVCPSKERLIAPQDINPADLRCFLYVHDDRCLWCIQLSFGFQTLLKKFNL